MNAPDPTLTSRISESVPSAIFFDMIDEAMRGMDSTVDVMSRRAYSFLSAGARPEPAGPPTLQGRGAARLVGAVEEEDGDE